MRCVLNAVGYQSGVESLLFYRPSPLLNIVDKSIIVHIIETLAQEGVRQFDIILNHLPYMIEERLKDGKRWGVSITYHLAKDYRYPFLPLKAISHAFENAAFLFGQGDELPDFSQIHFEKEVRQDPLLFMYQDDRWSGWGIFTPAIFSTLSPDMTMEQFPLALQKKDTCRVQPFLSVQTLDQLQKSNRRFISNPQHGHMFPSTSHMVEPRIWISRGVMIHPSVKIVPPVFIGENCQIKEHVQIGPQTVIERNCIIDAYSIIDHSLICRRSFVGEGLEIHRSIVDRNLLINVALDSHITIKDDFILGELNHISLSQFSFKWGVRFLGVLALGLLLPFYIYMRFTHTIKIEEILQLPASEDPQLWSTVRWKTFEPYPGKEQSTLQKLFICLPQLFNVIRGEANFLGVPPRTPQVVEHLANDWKRLYLHSKVGLITLSDLDNGAAVSTDECYASEVYYIVHMSFLYDLKLFFRWLKLKISSLFSLFSKEQPYA